MSTDYLPFPTYSPSSFPVVEDAPEFDPERHLALEMPESTISLETFGYDRSTIEQCPTELAMTAPFSILSDAGVEALFDVGAVFKRVSTLTENHPDAAYIKPRGCAYSSRFVQSLWTCPRVNEFFSDIAGVKLAPHPLPSAGAAFIFAPDDPARTNQGWHLDSVNFACVIALNDPETLSGGGFQYYRGTQDEIAGLIGVSQAELRTTIGRLGCLPAENTITVKFPRAGHGILMQGNLILHRGEPLSAKASRTMFVPSYIAVDVSYPDVTNWREMSKWNSPTMRSEYVRHKAWRAKQLLERMTGDLLIDDDPAVFKKAIDLAMAELSEAETELGS